MSVVLRPYQSRMVDSIREHWEKGHRVLGVLPTGGGKTEVAISIIERDASPASRALVIVERKTLCQQWVKRLHRHGISHVGRLQGDNTIALSASILVATAQSIRTRGVPEGVTLIVIDESHIWHQTHDTVLSAAPAARVLGLTATPLREGLGLRFDRIVRGATVADLIAGGQLVKPRYFAPRSDDIRRALAGVPLRAGDYATKELSAAMCSKTIIGDVVTTWQRHGENLQTIAFCVDKAHARDLCNEFVAAGIPAEVVVDDTDDDDRVRIFDAFDKRQVRVLVSVGVLGIGFDSPVASCAIMARPTMSTSLFIQQGGRVLRPFEGKAYALILDHACNVRKHGLLENFLPPTDLSKIDKRTDKKTRKDRAQVWVCCKCDAMHQMQEDICLECGHPRRCQTKAFVLDGELVPMTVEPGAALPGPTLDEVRAFYLQCVWYARAKSMGKPSEWAYYATRRRFRLDQPSAKRVIEWAWRNLDPIPPGDSAARWLRADFQRSMIAYRHRDQSANAHA